MVNGYIYITSLVHLWLLMVINTSCCMVTVLQQRLLDAQAGDLTPREADTIGCCGFPYARKRVPGGGWGLGAEG